MMIDASLNEVEGLAAKAARGAGLSWGLAEETGRAARWLAGCGFAWAPSLVGLLGRHGALATPSATLPRLRASAGADLSPLCVGSYLDDIDISASPIEIEAIAYPVWLVPFAARTGGVVEWDGGVAAGYATGWTIAGDHACLAVARTERVTWRRSPTAGVHGGPVIAARSRIDERDWQALIELGARTYVPASELSRQRGAGAGTIDND